MSAGEDYSLGRPDGTEKYFSFGSYAVSLGNSILLH